MMLFNGCSLSNSNNNHWKLSENKLLSYVSGRTRTDVIDIFRYELFCVSKQHSTPHCLVQCVVTPEQAWQWNTEQPSEQQYSKETFDALVYRYESPDSRNRWVLLNCCSSNGECYFFIVREVHQYRFSGIIWCTSCAERKRLDLLHALSRYWSKKYDPYEYTSCSFSIWCIS